MASAEDSVQPARRRITLGDLRNKYAFYAIGDVHGCLRELLDAEEKIRRDIVARQRLGVVIPLGDYVDRGPDSAGVLDHLCQNSGREFRRVPICGNHDELFHNFIADPQRYSHWLAHGGKETLHSYGIDAGHILRLNGPDGLRDAMERSIPARHRAFLRDLPVCVHVGPYLFVHAGIRPGIALENQSDEDLTWIREPFLTTGPMLPLTVIHGHTMAVEATFGTQRIGIDTGAYMTGNLSVLRIDEDAVAIL